MVGNELSSYLRSIRSAAGISLRGVQDATGGRVKNGYLSQIENGDIKSPSPTVLHDLAEVYGVDYSDLLRRAGHPAPIASPDRGSPPRRLAAIAGIPVSALADLSDGERGQVLDFLAFIKSRRTSN